MNEIKKLNNNTEFYVRYRKWNKSDYELKCVKGIKSVNRLIKKLLSEDLYTSIWIDDMNVDEFEEVYRRYYQQKDIIEERDTKIKNQAEIIRNLKRKLNNFERK